MGGLADKLGANKPDAAPTWRRWLAPGARAVVLAAIGAYLFYKLGELGWGEVLSALPLTPWFYLLFFARFLILPISEVFIYQRLWQVPMWRSLPIMFRKRVFNFGVVGYSGEAYFYVWARENVPVTNSQVLSAIKDNNVLSAVASNLGTLILLGVFMATPSMRSLVGADGDLTIYFIGAGVISVLIAAAAISFRRSLLDIDAKLALTLTGIHISRLFAVLLLRAAQWAVVVPQAPFSIWLVFLTIHLLLTRLPFLPNKDLVFLGVGFSLLSLTGAPETVVGAMFLAEVALMQLSHIVVFGLTSIGSHAPKGKATNRDESD